MLSSGKPLSHSPLYQNKNNTVFYGARGRWAEAPLNLNQVFEGQGRARVREGCLRGRIMGEGNLVVSLVNAFLGPSKLMVTKTFFSLSAAGQTVS